MKNKKRQLLYTYFGGILLILGILVWSLIDKGTGTFLLLISGFLFGLLNENVRLKK